MTTLNNSIVGSFYKDEPKAPDVSVDSAPNVIRWIVIGPGLKPSYGTPVLLVNVADSGETFMDYYVAQLREKNDDGTKKDVWEFADMTTMPFGEFTHFALLKMPKSKS